MRAPSEKKIDNCKDSFCEELNQVFNHFPNYHIKILFRDFNAKLGKEDNFNQQLGMTVYIRIEMIMVLNSKICHTKKSSC